MFFQNIINALFLIVPASLRARIQKSADFKRVSTNTLWLMVDYAIRLFFGFFVFVSAARILGPVQFGMYNYALSFSMIFLPIAGLGLDRIIVRDFVREPKNENEIAFTSFASRLSAGGVSFLLSLSMIILLRPNDWIMFWLVFMFSLSSFFQAFDVFDYWFQSQVQSRYVVMVKAGVFIIMSGCKLAVLFFYPSLLLLVGICTLENAFYAGSLFFIFVKKRNKLKFMVNLKRAIQMSKLGFPLVLSGLLIIFSMKVGQILIGQTIGERELGIYSAATRLSETTYIIITAATASVFPIFTALRKKTKTKYYIMLQKYFNFSGKTALIISISVTIMAKFIISLMYGEQYADSVRILQIHIWSTVAIFLSTAQGIWNINEGYTKIHLYQSLCNAIGTILLLLLLLPAYGIIGVAIASVLSPLFSTAIVNLFTRERRKILCLQIRSLNIFTK